MDAVLRDLKLKSLILCLDDVQIFASTFPEHLQKLEEVLQKIRQANLKLKSSKCCFAAEQLKLLGYLVSAEGILLNPENIASITNFERLTTLKRVRPYLGAASFYRKFCEEFSWIAAPLFLLLKTDQSFIWGTVQDMSLDIFGKLFAKAPLLAHFAITNDLIVETDAGMDGTAAVLSMEVNRVNLA